jgi:hypothetical protein
LLLANKELDKISFKFQDIQASGIFMKCLFAYRSLGLGTLLQMVNANNILVPAKDNKGKVEIILSTLVQILA